MSDEAVLRDDYGDDAGWEQADVCEECWGEGEIIVCPDDMCRGTGECVHTDGVRVCRNCRGTGYAVRV